jgi:ComF family protein
MFGKAKSIYQDISRHAYVQGMARFLMPPQCPACGQTGQGHGLCAACYAVFPWKPTGVCQMCGIPHAGIADDGSDTQVLCGQCLAHPLPFSRLAYVCRYDGVARDTILQLKNSIFRTDLPPLLAMWMHQAGADICAAADVVVPVPTSRRRVLRRGFNPASILANQIAAYADRPVVHALQRYGGRSQKGKGKAERFRNLQQQYAISPKMVAAIAGRRILLVDDVMTTGATAQICAKALLRAGGVNVDVVVFARVQPK